MCRNNDPSVCLTQRRQKDTLADADSCPDLFSALNHLNISIQAFSFFLYQVRIKRNEAAAVQTEDGLVDLQHARLSLEFVHCSNFSKV